MNSTKEEVEGSVEVSLYASFMNQKKADAGKPLSTVLPPPHVPRKQELESYLRIQATGAAGGCTSSHLHNF